MWLDKITYMHRWRHQKHPLQWILQSTKSSQNYKMKSHSKPQRIHLSKSLLQSPVNKTLYNGTNPKKPYIPSWIKTLKYPRYLNQIKKPSLVTYFLGVIWVTPWITQIVCSSVAFGLNLRQLHNMFGGEP